MQRYGNGLHYLNLFLKINSRDVCRRFLKTQCSWRNKQGFSRKLCRAGVERGFAFFLKDLKQFEREKGTGESLLELLSGPDMDGPLLDWVSWEQRLSYLWLTPQDLWQWLAYGRNSVFWTELNGNQIQKAMTRENWVVQGWEDYIFCGFPALHTNLLWGFIDIWERRGETL